MSKPTTETTSGNAFTHVAYVVRDGKEDQSFWTKIGRVWPHKDGKGFNIRLDATPINGEITLRERKQDEQED